MLAGSLPRKENVLRIRTPAAGKGVANFWSKVDPVRGAMAFRRANCKVPGEKCPASTAPCASAVEPLGRPVRQERRGSRPRARCYAKYLYARGYDVGIHAQMAIPMQSDASRSAA